MAEKLRRDRLVHEIEVLTSVSVPEHFEIVDDRGSGPGPVRVAVDVMVRAEGAAPVASAGGENGQRDGGRQILRQGKTVEVGCRKVGSRNRPCARGGLNLAVLVAIDGVRHDRDGYAGGKLVEIVGQWRLTLVEHDRVDVVEEPLLPPELLSHRGEQRSADQHARFRSGPANPRRESQRGQDLTTVDQRDADHLATQHVGGDRLVVEGEESVVAIGQAGAQLCGTAARVAVDGFGEVVAFRRADRRGRVERPPDRSVGPVDPLRILLRGVTNDPDRRIQVAGNGVPAVQQACAPRVLHLFLAVDRAVLQLPQAPFGGRETRQEGGFGQLMLYEPQIEVDLRCAVNRAGVDVRGKCRRAQIRIGDAGKGRKDEVHVNRSAHEVTPSRV